MEEKGSTATCGICRAALSGARLSACGTCHALYHPECWDWAGQRCATYACGTSEGGPTRNPGVADLGEIRAQAGRLIDAGKEEQAIGLLGFVLQRDPADSAALGLRGLAQWRLGKDAEADADFVASLSSRPDHPETLFNRACLLYEKERFDDARGLLVRCLDHAPADWKHRAMAEANLYALRGGSVTMRVVVVVIVGLSLAFGLYASCATWL